MRRYVLVSGMFFTVIACGHLIRLGFRAPVLIAEHDIPLWVSGLAVAVAGCLAVWAFRVGAERDASAAV